MNQRIERLVIWIMAEILFVFGAIVWLTSLRHVAVLGRPEELFHMSNRAVFRIMGTVALLASGYLLVSRNKRGAMALAAWAAIDILLYSVGLRWQGQASLLNYVGNMNNLPVSPAFLARVIYAAMGVVVGGSGWWLLCEWLANRRVARSKSTQDTGKLETSWEIGPGKPKTEGEAGAGG